MGVDSSVVKGGCKTVVGDRCKCLGMHWTEPTLSSRYVARFSTGERGLLGARCGGRPSGFCVKSDVHPDGTDESDEELAAKPPQRPFQASRD